MKKNLLYIFTIITMVFAACGDKTKQGTIVYQLAYQLPDSLHNYADYLPKQATVYFKGDSVVSVQGLNEESTTVITHKPTNYMLVLLKSATRHFQINYDKAEQAQEIPDISFYTFTKGTATKQIAGYNAQQYIMKNKITDESTEAWFTHDITLPPSLLTMFFDPAMGVPLAFSTNQNGFITKTTMKEVRFEKVPDGLFSAPAGYQKLTPQQLKEMPVEN